MARRRITSVIDQQHRLRELGRIRWGERQRVNERTGKPLVGRPLEFPRFSSSSEDVIRAVAEVYGGTPQPWDRDGSKEWDVTTDRPIAIAVPPGIECFTSAFEQWAKGFLTVRCDGVHCQYRAKGRWVERECVCEARGQDFKERPCKQTTRFTVMVIGVPILGVFRMDTKGFHASAEIPTTLQLLQVTGKAAHMQMRQRSDKVMVWDEKKGEDVPTGRRFWVITIDAPFLPDEVVAIERPPSMAALPAPARPALGRGERPQIGPSADIAPRGPQTADMSPPPPPVAPVDLEEVDGEVMPGDDEDPGTDGAWAASAPADQGSLLGDEPQHRDPVDA